MKLPEEQKEAPDEKEQELELVDRLKQLDISQPLARRSDDVDRRSTYRGGGRCRFVSINILQNIMNKGSQRSVFPYSICIYWWLFVLIWFNMIDFLQY